MRRILLIIVLCVFLAPALPVTAGEDYATRVKDGPKPEAMPDKASVYIVRPAKIGMAIRIWAFAEHIPLGMTKGKTYAHAYLDPGTYVFWSKAENVSAMTYTVEAGETYFLKQKVKMGGLKARTRVEFLSEEEGLEALEKCGKFSTLTEEGVARAEVIVADKLVTAREKAAEGEEE